MKIKNLLVKYSAFKTHFKKVKNINLEHHRKNVISKSQGHRLVTFNI